MRHGNIDLLAILPTGEGNAASTEQIVNFLGLSSDRVLRKLIAKARMDGAVICSCENGYFLPSNRSEIERFYYVTKKKAISTLAVLKSARMALNEVSGQQELEIDEVV